MPCATASSVIQVGAVERTTTDMRSGSALFEDAFLVGTTFNYAEIRGFGTAEGRFFTEADELHHSPVAFTASIWWRNSFRSRPGGQDSARGIDQSSWWKSPKRAALSSANRRIIS